VIDIIKMAVAIVFMSVGAFFMLTGSIGLIRFPDVYTRMHATGKCDTLGEVLILAGLIIYQGIDLISVKLLFIMAFVLITSPIATHAIFKAALTNGYEMWTKQGRKRWSKEEHK